MSCYYHHDRDSVGGCKSCGKSLCPECAVDLGKGLACRNHCEEDVRTLIAMIERSVKMSPQTASILESGRKIRSGAAVFNLVIGAVFFLWGLSDTRFSFIMILGVCFLVFGTFGLIQARKPTKHNQEKDDHVA
jgi:hypothetical protein